MKRGILFLVLSLALSGIGAAVLSGAQKPLTVSSAGGKKIRVALGRQTRIIDLSREISGYSKLYDPIDPSRRIHKAARIGVIDQVCKNRRHYLVIWALANGNYNVQGHCGAGEDCTLVWLQLDESLKPEKRQAVVVQECRAEIGIPDIDLEFPAEGLRLLAGRLELRFGDLIRETPAWSRLVYDKEACEKGLLVTAPEAGL